MARQLFLIVLCPHKDKFALHCINNIIMDFLSMNGIKNLFLSNFRILKCATKRECVKMGEVTVQQNLRNSNCKI